MESIFFIFWIVMMFLPIIMLTLIWFILQLIGIIILSIVLFLYGFFITITSNPLNIFGFLKDQIFIIMGRLLGVLFSDHLVVFEYFAEYPDKYPFQTFIIIVIMAFIYAHAFGRYKNHK